jgi:hypothetical protein
MRFLEPNEIAEWCDDRSIPLDRWEAPSVDDTLVHSQRVALSCHGLTGREAAIATAIVRALSPWDECLHWVTQTRIWECAENWPAYYAMRGQHGERRSLEAAPSQWFGQSEAGDLIGFLVPTLSNGWDAHVLPAVGVRPPVRAPRSRTTSGSNCGRHRPLSYSCRLYNAI